MAKSIKISKEYPGGNIKIIDIGDKIIKLEQDLSGIDGWWFYWNFCIENAEGEELIFSFENDDVLGPWGPSISRDGYIWEWAGKDCLINRKTFKYKFSEHDSKLFFSFCIPYVVKDFETFFSKYSEEGLLECKTLTLSEQGRKVPLVLIGNKTARNNILLTCRHHACEASASYLLEGLMEYLLNSSSNLLKDFLFHIVPFVDIDGVEKGEQGKNRIPHDHNRDYTNNPHYKSTAAIMNYIKDFDLSAAIDFHSPWKWGERNDFPFFIKTHDEENNNRIRTLGEIIRATNIMNPNKEKIVYDSSYDIEFGKDWNTKSDECADYYYLSQGAKLSVTFEFPYFGIDDTTFSQENMRSFGMDFGKAIEKYLSDINN